MIKISDEQRRVLKRLAKGGPLTPRDLRCSINTFKALGRRRLITVETTFDSITFPRNAYAWITDAGRVAIFQISADT